MPVQIKYSGLDEIQQRYKQFPGKFSQQLKTTISASLFKIWENVLPYPTANPDSTYIRTGQLGRSLGSSESGGKGGGTPDIFGVKSTRGYVTGEFGTNLKYAPFVIGEVEQARVHEGRWWTMRTVAEKSIAAIQRLFDTMVETLAKWLDQ